MGELRPAGRVWKIIHRSALRNVVTVIFQTKNKVKQTLAEIANQYITRCRAYYKVAVLPRERGKFLLKLDEGAAQSRKIVLDNLGGWTLKKRVCNSVVILVRIFLREFRKTVTQL